MSTSFQLHACILAYEVLTATPCKERSGEISVVLEVPDRIGRQIKHVLASCYCKLALKLYHGIVDRVVFRADVFLPEDDVKLAERELSCAGHDFQQHKDRHTPSLRKFFDMLASSPW